MEFDLVIKVKYGDTMRRINAYVNENEMELNMAKLMDKIHTLFQLSPDADLTLTYVDEDKDVVTLVEDDDLRDAIFFQRLNPLRINVSLNGDSKSVPPHSRTQSGSSTPLRPPRIPIWSPSLGASVEEAMRSVPQPLRDTLLKLTNDLVMKATSTSPMISELVACASNLGLNSTDASSHSSDGRRPADAPKSTVDLTSTRPAGAYGGSVTESKVVSGGNDFVDQPHNDKGPPAHPPKGSWEAASSVAPVDFERDASGMMPLFMAGVGDPGQQIKNASQYVDLLSGDIQASVSTNLPRGEGDDENKELSAIMGPSVSPADSQGRTVINDKVRNVTSPGISQVAQHLFKRSSSHHDGMLRTFHRGVQCDGCGMHPIVGPRFKSKVKEDYDLCNICFSEMGNEDDYVRIDRAVHRPPRHSCNPHPPHFQIPAPPCRGPGLKFFRPKLESRFIQDVTVLDGTQMAPATPFVKIWRMRNNGTQAWPMGSKLVWIGGDKFGDRDYVELEIPPNGYPVDKELDVAVDFTSPSRPGRYISYWKMASPLGQKFGQRVWVLIQVLPSARVDWSQGNRAENSFYPSLNLNLPPVSSNDEQTGKGLVDVNIESENGPDQAVQSNGTAEQVKPLVHEHAGGSVETAEDSENKASDSVVYPIIDVSAPPHPGTTDAYPNSSEATNPVEEALLKELEDMGFKLIDLNKEVLRKNEYDLENSVDDLCGITEWDPILEELQEMGFSDRQMNKKLLIKNGGSIKRVVLDLLAEEKP